MEASTLAKVTAPAYLIRSVSAIAMTYAFFRPSYDPIYLMSVFGLANLLFGLSILGGFLLKCGKPSFEMPTIEELKSIKPFAVQTIFQWLFSQGERLVQLYSYSETQIGVYGFVSDLSSLVARIIFAPIESSIFSICSTSKFSPIDIVCIAARFVVCIGLFSASFGHSIAPPIISRVYGKRWSGEESKVTLSAFCRIMPLMALNGVTEAYANARLPPSDLETYNIFIAVVSGIYFLLMFVFGKLFASAGPIYANGVNMLLRSILAILVIFMQNGFQRSLFPNSLALGLFVASAIISHYSGFWLSILCAFLMLGFVFLQERESIRKVLHSFKKE